MRHGVNSSVLTWALAPVLSLEELAAGLDPDSNWPAFEIPDPSCGPEAQLERTRAFQAVGDFVRALSPRDQEIVRHMFWHDETQTVVAQRFGVSKMAISKAMARILKQGRAALTSHRHLALMN
jgi:RNA polymerase sigma factor (sigma-70 family)